MHIGFRVHAHIYNLSRRNCSVLIEEDGRGAGVNQALGLCPITAYDYAVKTWPDGEHMISTVGKSENAYLLQLLDDHLNNLYQVDFLQIRHAFRLDAGVLPADGTACGEPSQLHRKPPVIRRAADREYSA